MDERDACLDSLAAALERLARAQRLADDPALRTRLRLLQDWQARRLAGEYADQRELPRRRDAVEFFLADVYGARDFAERDAQFARAIHRLRAMLPLPALQALRDAIELQALTHELDVALAASLDPHARVVDAAGYAQAYRAVGRLHDRARQVDLALAIGERLQHLTRHPTIELMLRLAAVPARLAGYGELQAFIERGYAAFRRLGTEAADFLATIAVRERAFFECHAAVAPAHAPAGDGRAGGAGSA
jgi:hypothetical protein